MEKPKWIFTQSNPDDVGRESVTGEFFESSRLDAVIREAIQNSLDAADGKPVTVRFFHSGAQGVLPGAEYAAKYRGESVDIHYSHPESGIAAMVPLATEACDFLTIEDFQTTGLTGDVTLRPTEETVAANRKAGNYYNYFFRENRSNKDGAGVRGSWGAGKIMFMKASRLRTAFALSVRDDPFRPRILAGRTVLMSHSIDDDYFAPDGWFGIEATPPTSSNKRFLRKQPIVDGYFLDAFSQEFHLIRKNEPGTSIVIPYLDIEDETVSGTEVVEKIARAVVVNFMTSIIAGDLKVVIDSGDLSDSVIIDQGQMATAQKYLLSASSQSDSLVVREHFNLAIKAFAKEMSPDTVFRLIHAHPGAKPVWVDEMFDGIDFKTIKKLANRGIHLLFSIPMTVLEKDGAGGQKKHSDSFFVALEKIDNPIPLRPAFYRDGLLIDRATMKTVGGYAAIVKIDNGAIARMLVASEKPSHSSWESDLDRIKKSYFYPAQHISFVTSAVHEIVSRIEQADQDPDWNPLIGSFGIPKDPKEDKPVRGKQKRPDTIKNEEEGKGKDEPDHEKVEFPMELIHLEKIKSKVGFVLSTKGDHPSKKGYPFYASFRMGYAPFTKCSWSPFDFNLSDRHTIEIVFENPEQGNIAEIILASENRLKLKIHSPGVFRLYVTGFDPNRDLDIIRERYDFSEVITSELVNQEMEA